MGKFQCSFFRHQERPLVLDDILLEVKFQFIRVFFGLLDLNSIDNVFFAVERDIRRLRKLSFGN